MILVKLKKILLKVQNLAQQESGDMTLHNFSMELDVMEYLPDMNLQVQNTKLRGQEVAIFSKLNNRAQMVQQSWYLEVALKYAFRMKQLVQYAKESGRIKHYWGKHAHLTEVTDMSTTICKMKKQVNLTQSYTDYQVSMLAEDLVGVVSLAKQLKSSTLSPKSW
jgi:hypothetical protein